MSLKMKCQLSSIALLFTKCKILRTFIAKIILTIKKKSYQNINTKPEQNVYKRNTKLKMEPHGHEHSRKSISKNPFSREILKNIC